MSLDNKMNIRAIKEAKKFLTDLAFDEKRISYPTEFEAVRKGVQALSIVGNIPHAIEEICKYYLEMTDGEKKLSIAEYNDFVLQKFNDLYKQSVCDVEAIKNNENNSTVSNAESVDEFRIVLNVVNYTKGLKNTANWRKVQSILLAGSKHSGRTRSIEKAFELGVDPYSVVWEKVGAK